MLYRMILSISLVCLLLVIAFVGQSNVMKNRANDTPRHNSSPAPVDNKHQKLSLVVFSATWCGPCQNAKPYIQMIEAKGYKVTRVDIDLSPEQMRSWGVTSVPTFFVMENNRIVKRTQNVFDLLPIFV